jgi:hypothetical protein
VGESVAGDSQLIMTLILTAATRDFIVQVSDRRLTYPDGTLLDDNTTKAVFYCGRVAVGYTGSAKIQNRSTAEWLAHVIARHKDVEAGLDDAISQLERIASKYSPKILRLAFVATGWATEKLAGRLDPAAFIYTVSNILAADGTWLQDPIPRWVKRLEWLESSASYILGIAGQDLTNLEKQAIDQMVSASLRSSMKGQNPPNGLARALGETIRKIASEASERGKRVGSGLIVQALSKKAVMSGIGRMILSPLTPDANSAIYVAPDGRSDRWESPYIACDGRVFTGGGGSIPPGGKSMFER